MAVLRLFVIALLAWAALPPDAAYAQTTGDPSFALVNRSNRTINEAYVSPSRDTNWGPDRLGANTVLPSGRRFRIELPQGQCQWDVAVVYDDGREEAKRNLNLCSLAEVSFDGSNARAAAPAQGGQQGGQPRGQQGGQQGGQQPRASTGDPSFALVNRSGQTIQIVLASPTGTRSEEGNRLGNSVLQTGRRFQIDLPRGPCQWTVAVGYADGRNEIKAGLDLCSVTEVVFDASQARAPSQQPQPPGGQRPPAQQAQQPRISFGTGFFISAQGHMLTNEHVIEGCRALFVHVEGQRLNARLVRADETNDLALLRVDVREAPAFARFRSGAPIRPGDGVVVAGFPLQDVLQNGLNITTGNVSATVGLGGNTARMQITAPVQPGNSGGPLLDLSGNVVGVIVSGLRGDGAQNINFAVQGAVARIFVEAGGQRIVEAPSARELRPADVGDQSRNFTFQIECRG